MSRKTKKRSVLKTILIILLLVLLASFITGYIITASQMKKFFPRYEKIAPEFNAGYQYDHYEAEIGRAHV